MEKSRASLNKALSAIKMLSQIKAASDHWSWTKICHTKTGKKMLAKVIPGKTHVMRICRFQCNS